MRTHRIRFHETGGPEVLQWEEAEIGDPGPGEALLRQSAVGLNLTDTYNRKGLYKRELPSEIGFEAAGIVAAVGPGVQGLKEGDRVAYAGPPIGAYAEARLYPADRLVPLPNWIDERTAASCLLRAMTVEYLLGRTYPVARGDTILVHAAAGGLGILLCQWAKFLGVDVIAAVGSREKVEIAQANGASHVVVTSDPHWVAQVRDVTDGAGVPVVYDPVGKDTFEGSIACLARRGLMVSFGSASGPLPPVDVSVLFTNGSLYLTRPSLWDYIATRQELMESASAVFDMLHRGATKPVIARTYPLAEAAEAHRAIESRMVTGSIVLLP